VEAAALLAILETAAMVALHRHRQLPRLEAAALEAEMVNTLQTA
jgi:hypothetical protein